MRILFHGKASQHASPCVAMPVTTSYKLARISQFSDQSPITVKMKLCTSLIALAAASSAAAFAPSAFTPRSSVSVARGPSSLQMVADDAKVILVTGSSRGLGRSIALDLGAAGQKVVVNYAGSEDAANQTVEDIKAAGGDAIAVQSDGELRYSLPVMVILDWKAPLLSSPYTKQRVPARYAPSSYFLLISKLYQSLSCSSSL